jgi:hypothetical protein
MKLTTSCTTILLAIMTARGMGLKNTSLTSTALG